MISIAGCKQNRCRQIAQLGSTRKEASTALNSLRSKSAPATVDRLTIFRLWHTANICLSLLPHRNAVCSSLPKTASFTGTTPCKSACTAAEDDVLQLGLMCCCCLQTLDTVIKRVHCSREATNPGHRARRGEGVGRWGLSA